MVDATNLRSMPNPTIPPKKKQKTPSPELEEPKIRRDIGKTSSELSVQAVQEPGDTDDGKKVTSKSNDFETAQEKHLTLLTGQVNLSAVSTKELQDELNRRRGPRICSDTGDTLVSCGRCGMTFSLDFKDSHVCPAGKSMTLQRAPAKPKEDYDTDDELNKANNKMIRTEALDETFQKYTSFTSYSRAHGAKRNKLQQDLIDTCVANADDLGPMAKLVEDEKIPGRLIPKAFVKAGGLPTRAKTIMVSNLMWHMMRSRKNTRAKKESVHFLNQIQRILISELASE